MKKINLLFGALVTLFFISCEGPQGPPGLNGFDGSRWRRWFGRHSSAVFELDVVNFDYNDPDNLYETLITFSDFTNFETRKADAVLVYRYDGPVEFQSGSTEDSWGLLPQNFFLNEGTIQYVFYPYPF